MRAQVALKLAREVFPNAGIPTARVIVGWDNAINQGAQRGELGFRKGHEASFAEYDDDIKERLPQTLY
jgi:hypothetical protein